jgi:hypothetical protein
VIGADVAIEFTGALGDVSRLVVGGDDDAELVVITARCHARPMAPKQYREALLVARREAMPIESPAR